MKKAAFAMGLSLLLLNFAEAEAARADRRQRHQGARIRQGVRTGKIDTAERKDLRQEQVAIKKKKHEMRTDDGRLDASERKELRQDQNAASKDIFEAKHN